MPYATSMGHLDCITVLNFLCLPSHTSAGMGPKPIVLPNLPTKYSHKNSSACIRKEKRRRMQQTPFNRGKQRRKKLGDYSHYSIPDLPTSSLQSCARLHTSGRESARNRLGFYVLTSGSLHFLLSKQSETIMHQTVKPEVPLREHPMALSIYNFNPVITTGTAIIS